MSLTQSDFSIASASVEARALAMCARYLREMWEFSEPLEVAPTGRIDVGDEELEDISDGFIAGFRAGYRSGRKDTFEACSNLAVSLQQFNDAVTRVENLMLDHIENIGA